MCFMTHQDFPGGSDGKASVYNVRDLGSTPGLGKFPGEGNGNPSQYSCLENPMDGEPGVLPGVARVGHNLVTKPPPPIPENICIVIGGFGNQNVSKSP